MSVDVATPGRRSDEPLRADIAGSWRRSRLAGLSPDLILDRVPTWSVDPDSALLRTVRPVLDRVADDLDGSDFFTVLADGAARIVDRGRVDARTRDTLDATGVVVGREFTEETTGTNAISAPFELRRGVAVHGDEHFAEAVRRYSCYGHPIVHPITRRLEGVLDLAGAAGRENPLFAPFLRQAVVEIEHELVASSPAAQQRLWAAFRAATSRPGRGAVVAVGREGDLVLANRAASEHLDAEDYARLREIAAAHRRPSDRTVRFTTVRGLRVDGAAEVADGRGGVLFSFAAPAWTGRAHAAAWVGAAAAVERAITACRDTRTSVVVAGEPGSGRTTAVSRILPDAPPGGGRRSPVPPPWTARGSGRPGSGPPSPRASPSSSRTSSCWRSPCCG